MSADTSPPAAGAAISVAADLPPREACGVTRPTRPAPLDPTCVARAAAAPLPPARPSASPFPGNLSLATRCRFPAPQTPAAAAAKPSGPTIGLGQPGPGGPDAGSRSATSASWAKLQAPRIILQKAPSYFDDERRYSILASNRAIALFTW
eukprot:CAMPEP_0173425768 /NCGR_PEP_ID=MMETSP1357-20121228/5397_1 /TAXON_ID=77926 /ORGANISM="Hemiselmis rufescens, Strain PCC563" /LENGTH=149 /DNA_ID=CAMNT_0014389281 /DNA_START=532 /DNA_END=979 /DNA_ORIENTATION=-